MSGIKKIGWGKEIVLPKGRGIYRTAVCEGRKNHSSGCVGRRTRACRIREYSRAMCPIFEKRRRKECTAVSTRCAREIPASKTPLKIIDAGNAGSGTDGSSFVRRKR